LLSRQNESVWLELSELVDILYAKASDAEYSVPPIVLTITEMAILK